MMNSFRMASAVFGMLGLLGCGGAGGEEEETPSQMRSNQSQNSMSASGAAVNWNVANATGGHGVSALGTLNGGVNLAQSSGSATNGSPLNIDDGYFFSSSGFLGSNAAELSGNGLVSIVSLPSSYGHGFIYEGFRGNQSVFLGVFGNQPNSIPNSGSVTWTGDAVARYQTGGSSVSLSGNSTVRADFSVGTAGLVIDGISGAPFDELSISGMTISGSRFEGGSVQTSAVGSVVDVVGSGASASSSGVFFGSGSGGPDEVGGVFVFDGNSGTVAGAYLAD